jgi:hypothetical protein
MPNASFHSWQNIHIQTFVTLSPTCIPHGMQGSRLVVIAPEAETTIQGSLSSLRRWVWNPKVRIVFWPPGISPKRRGCIGVLRED